DSKAVPINSRPFKDLLSYRHYKKFGKALTERALKDKLSVLNGRALFEGPEQGAYTRIAKHGDSVILNLGDGRAVIVTKGGWEITDKSPIAFFNPRGSLKLPDPVRGGSIDELRALVPVSDETWPLVVCWLVMALWPTGAYPPMVITSEQGSGKTSNAKLCRFI